MIISFCGHSNFSSTPQLKNKLMELLETTINGKQVEFYLGGYGGFDSFARSCCAEYKERHQNATLIFVTPYLGDYLNNRKDYIEKYYDTSIRIPMVGDNRSLNLSNSVAIVLYEALRQNGFPDMNTEGELTGREEP